MIQESVFVRRVVSSKDMVHLSEEHRFVENGKQYQAEMD